MKKFVVVKNMSDKICQKAENRPLFKGELMANDSRKLEEIIENMTKKDCKILN